ncbi:methyl-accepting chemotaxis protein [Clostridium kluyveri]|uniref:Chemotaxis protein n=1 Tax=Clostridium kluyveri TaxID=1534 RepID=A0A1L5FCJ4_CLOKL|nr:methyl-accepting chemotaxis protein [Clostridium kluyveri]APM40739.1 chemotaxis protein [Clostridium kluyveri]UZQ49158.1 methyl-accepting chemotaxis protein [Clostridium kluyveri]
MKFLKFNENNLKIIHMFTLLSIIALLTNLFIGFIAYFNMHNLNSDIENLYNNQLYKVKEAGYINGELGQLRNALTKIIDRPYDQNNVDLFNSKDKEIQNTINDLSSIKLSEKEKNLLNKARENYNEYIEGGRQIIDRRSRGEILDTKFTDEYGKIGASMSSTLTQLNDEILKTVKNTYISSNKHFNSSILILIVVTIVSMAAIIFISIFTKIFIKRSIINFFSILKRLEDGDFTIHIDKSSNNEFGEMKRELAITLESIIYMIRDVKNNTLQINKETVSLASASEEMSSLASQVREDIQQVSKGSQKQAYELMEIKNYVGEFGNSIDTIVSAVKEVADESNSVNVMSSDSNLELSRLLNSLSEIQKDFESVVSSTSELENSINNVNKIINIINDIADQTNLLSLNAAIEASRVGEAGKGFAVVAEEIGKLAEQSKNSSSDITDILSIISSETKKVTNSTSKVSEAFKDQENIVENSMSSFKGIIGTVDKIIPLIDNINKLITGIDKEKGNITKKVKNAFDISEENRIFAEQIAISSDEMSTSSNGVATSAELLTEVLENTLLKVNKFKV